MKRFPILLLLGLMAGQQVFADDEGVVKKIDNSPKSIGNTVRNGGGSAGRSVEKGLRAVGNGIKKGVESFGNGQKKAGSKPKDGDR